jgi:hypothetical protein
MYDENQTTNVCELTPSYYLEFLYNVPEHVPEAEDGNGPTIPGYDDFSAFERDNGDEPGCYTHCRDVDRLDDRFKHDLQQADAETIERYRCAPPHLREELYRELTEEVREYPLCNRVFEGCFDPVETPAPSP